jgi:hypothetical protein
MLFSLVVSRLSKRRLRLAVGKAPFVMAGLGPRLSGSARECASVTPNRHARACPGHPRRCGGKLAESKLDMAFSNQNIDRMAVARRSTWMAGTSPAMTLWG